LSLDKLCRKVEERPSDPLTHYHLATALYHYGKLSAAATEFQKALALQPGLAEAHNDLGVILDQQGKPQEPLQEFGEAVKANPDNPEARYNLGLAFARTSKDYQQARTELEQAVRLNSQMGKAYYELGGVYEDLGDATHARREFEQAIALNAEDSEAHYALASLLRREGDRAASEAHLARFNQLKEQETKRDFATRAYRSGTLLAQRKEWDRAIE
jgi:tetratricopeptide (TPR) repeat protein